jgi:hypothetical protein
MKQECYPFNSDIFHFNDALYIQTIKYVFAVKLVTVRNVRAIISYNEKVCRSFNNTSRLQANGRL